MMSPTEVTPAGVDGSKESPAVIEWAADRVIQFGGQVHVLCTYALISYSVAALDGGCATLDGEMLRRDTQQVVEEVVEIARSRGGVRASSSIEPGDLADTFAGASHEVDLVAVSSRGGDSFVNRPLGAVSSALPAHVQRPVVVIPRHTAGRKFMPVERTAVGVDGPEVPSSALRKAVDRAEGWEARLTAVSAVLAGSDTSMIAWTPNVDYSALLDNVRKGVGKVIDQTLRGCTMEVARHTLDDAPASLPIEFPMAVDLVVVGTRSWDGLTGALFGSTL